MNLQDAIRAIIDEIQRLGIEDFENALVAIGDDIETGERDDDLFADAVIDGIRFGARAAVSVELAGGAMVRFIMPQGERITSEWAIHADAEDQIKAALAAMYAERTSAEGVGE